MKYLLGLILCTNIFFISTLLAGNIRRLSYRSFRYHGFSSGFIRHQR